MLNLKMLFFAAGLAVSAQSALGQSCNITIAQLNAQIDAEVAELNALIADGQTGWITLRDYYLNVQDTYLSCNLNAGRQQLCNFSADIADENVMTPSLNTSPLRVCP